MAVFTAAVVSVLSGVGHNLPTFFPVTPFHSSSSQYQHHPPDDRRLLSQQQQQQQQQTRSAAAAAGQRQQQHPPPPQQQPRQRRTNRLLYIVTSIHEYDIGRRETVEGYDRFSNTLVPVIRDAVASMVDAGYQPDVYLIAHYNVTDVRYAQLRASLPESVGLEIWNDATPLYYRLEDQPMDDVGGTTNTTTNQNNRIQHHTRGLARQHRYVIKDKMFHYDIFVNFEDDMLLRGSHITHYTNLTDQIYAWRRQQMAVFVKQQQQHQRGGGTTTAAAVQQQRQRQLQRQKSSTTTGFPAAHTTRSTITTVEEAKNVFYGNMTFPQLARTIPGFIRVEAALPDFRPVPHNQFAQIPVRYDYYPTTTTTTTTTTTVSGATREPPPLPPLLPPLDPSVCCHVGGYFNGHVPVAPNMTDLYHWETSIDALGVRRLPNDVDWVVLLGGSNQEIWDEADYIIGDFWSGRAGDYFPAHQPRPDRKKGRYMNNQGGWMGTRRQIMEWHERWCRGGFLP
jgi:sRNA-binding protein